MVAGIGKTLKTVFKVIYVHNITVKFKQHDYKNTKSQTFIFAMMRLCANAHMCLCRDLHLYVHEYRKT